MSFGADVVSILVTAGVGSSSGASKNIFLGESVNVPSDDGPYLSVSVTGGTTPLQTHGSTAVPRMPRPSVQLVARAPKRVDAYNMLVAAYAALHAVRNTTIGGVFYLQLRPAQEIFDFGLDAVGRPRVAVNFDAIKAYSA